MLWLECGVGWVLQSRIAVQDAVSSERNTLLMVMSPFIRQKSTVLEHAHYFPVGHASGGAVNAVVARPSAPGYIGFMRHPGSLVTSRPEPYQCCDFLIRQFDKWWVGWNLRRHSPTLMCVLSGHIRLHIKCRRRRMHVAETEAPAVVEVKSGCGSLNFDLTSWHRAGQVHNRLLPGMHHAAHL